MLAMYLIFFCMDLPDFILIVHTLSNTNVQCTVIIQMDADQLFLNDRVDVSSVRFGKALAFRRLSRALLVMD